MKRCILSMLVVLAGLIVAALMVSPAVANAQPSPTTFNSPILPPVDLGGVEGWLAAIGLLPFVPIVVEILKRFKVIPDGSAATWSTFINIALFFLLTVLGVFGIDVSGDSAQSIYAILIQVGTLILMIFGSPALYRLARHFGIVKPMAGRE